MKRKLFALFGMVHFAPDKAEKLVDKLGHTSG